MRIEYVFDTVCPWCYVGKRRLERALASCGDVRADIVWRPFMLNPDMPADGIDRQHYLERKFGGAARVQRVHASVAAAGRSEGISFSFDTIRRTPNTMNSHRMIRYAGSVGCESAMVEAIFAAYFCRGLDIGDPMILAALAEELGLQQETVLDYLRSEMDCAAMVAENGRAHRLGVNGVPCLIIEGTYALAGAQEPEILLRLINIARETEAEKVFSAP